MEVHVGLQNCSYNQFTTLSLQVFMRVNVRHISVSAVKNSYNGKKTLQPLGERLQQKTLKQLRTMYSGVIL